MNTSTEDIQSITSNIISKASCLDNSLINVFGSLRKKQKGKIIIGHININSIRKKFDALVDAIRGNLDILMISETKIDESFPAAQFLISGYSQPYRLDRNCFGGGILLYIREDIPSKNLFCEKLNKEIINVELNIANTKWLLSCNYNPHKAQIASHLNELRMSLEKHSKRFDNKILLGDFNCEFSESVMIDFCHLFDLKSLIKEPTCFKNPERPSNIDLILTNKNKEFLHSCTIETGLSDFHKMTVTCLKKSYKKLKPNILTYRDYRNFDSENFKTSIHSTLVHASSKIFENTDKYFNSCMTSFQKILDENAPIKKVYERGNNAPFMNKEIRKAIMTRSRLLNLFLKSKSILDRKKFNKQRNHCVSLLRKTKKTNKF